MQLRQIDEEIDEVNSKESDSENEEEEDEDNEESNNLSSVSENGIKSLDQTSFERRLNNRDSLKKDVELLNLKQTSLKSKQTRH